MDGIAAGIAAASTLHSGAAPLAVWPDAVAPATVDWPPLPAIAPFTHVAGAVAGAGAVTAALSTAHSVEGWLTVEGVPPGTDDVMVMTPFTQVVVIVGAGGVLALNTTLLGDGDGEGTVTFTVTGCGDAGGV